MLEDDNGKPYPERPMDTEDFIVLMGAVLAIICCGILVLAGWVV